MKKDKSNRLRGSGSLIEREYLPIMVSFCAGVIFFLTGYTLYHQPGVVLLGVLLVILGIPLWMGYRDHSYMAALVVAAFPATATVIGPWMASAPSSGYMNYVSLILGATAVTNPIATITYAVGFSTGDGELLRNRLQTFAVRLIGVLLYTIFVALGFYFAILDISTIQ
jgi:hypothetical protein